MMRVLRLLAASAAVVLTAASGIAGEPLPAGGLDARLAAAPKPAAVVHKRGSISVRFLAKTTSPEPVAKRDLNDRFAGAPKSTTKRVAAGSVDGRFPQADASREERDDIYSVADRFQVPDHRYAETLMHGSGEERLPAVSGINAKIEGLGGVIDGEALGAVGGSISVPVPFIPFMGVQVDALIGNWDNDVLSAGALHIFLRDPDIGLIGAYGDWTYVSPEHYGRVGAEFEVYFGRWNLEGIVGGSFGQNVETEFFDDVMVAFYPTDDLRVSLGHVYSQLGHQGKVGAEYQLPFQAGIVGTSIFAEGRYGEDDYYGAWAGLRFYVASQQKSLIRRHREDDPRSRLPSTIAPLTNCGFKTGEGAFCGSDDDLDPRPVPVNNETPPAETPPAETPPAETPPDETPPPEDMMDGDGDVRPPV